MELSEQPAFDTSGGFGGCGSVEAGLVECAGTR